MYRTYAIPRFVMKCLFMGISRSEISPYVLKISRRCEMLTFLVSFSMTILAERGCEGAGEREPLWALRGVRDLLREAMDRSRLRERLGLRLSRPLARSLERDLDRRTSSLAVRVCASARERHCGLTWRRAQGGDGCSRK